MIWMELGISHDSHKSCYRATLKFILMDAFCMKENNYCILHSQSGRKPKATNHSITELNWKKTQLLKHRKNSIILYLSLSTITLSLLTYPLFFRTGNVCKTVSGIPVGGKYLFWKGKNPALTQLNLAAKVDLIHSEDKGRSPNTTLGSFGSFGLRSSPFPAAHTAWQLRPLPGTSTDFCTQPVIVEDLLTEESSSNHCVGQCNT